MSNPFFGTGYKEKPVFNVSVDVMGKVYNANNSIEFIEGDIIVDGVKSGLLPITSGTWIKVLKGEWFDRQVRTKKI